MKPEVSIILPSYNEEAIIGETLHRLAAFLERHRSVLGSHEVIVVAAGTDRTAHIAREQAADFDDMQVITPKRRVGKGRDVRLGVRAAKGDVYIFMDADLATPLTHILPAIEALRSGNTDVVIGVRNLNSIHAARSRALLSVASNLLIRTVLFPGVRDTQCGFKGFTKNAAKTLFAEQRIMGWGFDLEVLQYAKENNLRLKQIPISDWHESRTEDLRGQRTSSAALTSLKDLVQVRTGAWARSLARHWLLVTLLIVAASCGVSLWIGLQQSVWFDESYSIALVQQSYQKMIALTAVDAHPPLYYIALKAWTTLFGTGEIALRSLSVLFFGGAAVGGVWLVRRLFSARAAVVVLVLVALSPFLLRYGFEIRMYAMAGFIGIMATHALLSAVRAEGHSAFWWWAAYATLVALGMYTLYYTAFIWIAHFLWMIYLRRTSDRQVPAWRQPWVSAIVGSVALFALWLPTFIFQLTHSALSGVSQAVTYKQLMSTVSFMVNYKAEWQLGPWESLGVITVLIISITVIAKAWRVATAKQRSGLMLLILYMLTPVGILLIVTLPPLKPMFLERYLSHVAIAGYLLVGASLAILYRALPRAWVALAGFFITIMLLVGIYNLNGAGNFTFERLMRPHAKEVAAQLGDCTGQAVIADDPLLYFELHYYLPATCNLMFYNDNQPVGDRGGYALLHDSPQELYDNNIIATPQLSYVFTGEKPKFNLHGYHQTAVYEIEKFHVATYRR